MISLTTIIEPASSFFWNDSPDGIYRRNNKLLIVLDHDLRAEIVSTTFGPIRKIYYIYREHGWMAPATNLASFDLFVRELMPIYREAAEWCLFNLEEAI